MFKPGGPGYILEDGSLEMKTPWWRLSPGRLSVEGQRLDAPAPPMRSYIPDGYAAAGFQPVGLIFPTPGCWKITARLGAGSLSFVTIVDKIADGPCSKANTKPNELVGTIRTSEWSEDPYLATDQLKLTRITAKRSYDGGIHGVSTLALMVTHRTDGGAGLVGYEVVKGSMNGMAASLVIQHVGTIENSVTRSVITILETLDTPDNASVVGQGSTAGIQEAACYSLIPTRLPESRN